MTTSGRLGSVAGIPWRPVKTLTGGGLVLIGVAATWTTSVVAGGALVVGVANLAAATAYVLDEAAAEAVAATPTSLRARSGVRALVALAVLGLGTAGLGVLALRSGAGARLGIVLWMAGCVLVAVAAAASLRRRVAEPGEAVAGALLTVVVAVGILNPVARWVDVFPSERGDRWAGACLLWAVVGLICAAVLARATRDPLA